MSNLPEILKSAERTAAILEDMADMRAQEADYEWEDEEFFNTDGALATPEDETDKGV